MTVYAIGDIHGHLDKLQHAHARISADRARIGNNSAPVVHIGDLVDRGPDSRGVIDFLIRGIAAGAPWVVLKGNHDRMMSLYLQDPPARDPCLRPDLEWTYQGLGGLDTMASYGVRLGSRPDADIHRDFVAAVPDSHVAFLAELPAFHRIDGDYFCHAGIRPGVALEEQVEDDLIWIRDAFHNDPADHGALIVHGHTPVKVVTDYGNRVNLDIGAGYGRDISAVVIEGRDVFLLTSQGRKPVHRA